MTKNAASPAGSDSSLPAQASNVGKLFFLIRVLSAVMIGVWLLSVVAQVEEINLIAGDLIGPFPPLMLWFLLYSVFLHLLSWKFPARRAKCFIAMSVLDAIFVTLLVQYTGKLQSSFFLAYYFLIMTTTFTLGLTAGAATTFLSAIGYLAVFVGTPYDLFIGDLMLRIGFLFLVFFAMSLLSESELRDKLRLGESRKRLEDTVEELVGEKKAIEKTAEEKSELLRFQRDLTERRQDHLRFAKEINALNDIEEVILRFHRYISRLVGADDVSLALMNRDGAPPTLYSVAEGKIVKREIPKTHPALKEMLDGRADDEMKKWTAAPDATLPKELTVTDLPVKSMWAETLTGGEGGITGALIVSHHKNAQTDPDRMDEVRILCSHFAVAIENLKLCERLEDLAETDALTGIFNRRHFQHALARELRRSERYSRPLGLIMMDIDHFKDMNDEYGHPAGDAVLLELAKVISALVRNIDVFARYGGEEFAVVLPETSLTGTAEVAERLRREVEDHVFPISDEESVQISVSLGAAAYPIAAKDAEALVSAADDALYRAKEGGRNRVEKAVEEKGAVEGDGN